MIPPNRIRPTNDILESLRLQLESGEISVRQIAEQWGVRRSSVNRWLQDRRSQRVWPWEADPKGFDAACLTVAQGGSKISVVARVWSCGCKRVRERMFELTGIRNLPGGQPRPKAAYHAVATIECRPGRNRREAELAKRRALQVEIERLKQPMRMAG